MIPFAYCYCLYRPNKTALCVCVCVCGCVRMCELVCVKQSKRVFTKVSMLITILHMMIIIVPDSKHRPMT